MRVLVAGDDYYSSLAVVRGLKAAGYEPWFAASSPRTFAAHSRATAGAFTLPRTEHGDDEYVAALAEAARACDPALVLPCNELAIKAVAGRESAFPEGVVVASNPPEVVIRATDKAELTRLAAEAGIAVPPSMELGLDDLDEHRDRISFPAIAKPASTAVREPGRTWLAPPPRIVADAAALEDALRRAPRWLVQPFLDGALTAVAGVARRGEALCTVHQAARRIFPRRVGVSAYAETIPVDATLDEALRRVIRELGWSGIFEFQLIRTADAAHLIDLNPRPYGSLGLAIAAGANLPAIWAGSTLGRESRIEPYRVGVRYRAELREGRALLSAIRGGRAGEALAILRPRANTVHSVLSVRDPLPLLAVLQRGLDKLRR